MGETTGISWTDATFNLVIGCTKVVGSPACNFCYAEAFSKRIGLKVWGQNAPRKTLSDAYWRAPLKWNREALEASVRRRVFCSSLADVFEDHPTVEEQRARLWPLIVATPMLDWLLLTKRPQNVAPALARSLETSDTARHWLAAWLAGHSPENVWLGVTAEDQMHADERIPTLAALPARVHFVSYEPALEAVDFSRFLSGLDWIICGGESGPKARPFRPEWSRDVQRQINAHANHGGNHVAFFHKQMGSRPTGDIWPMNLKHRHGANPDEWPPQFRLQEFPA